MTLIEELVSLLDEAKEELLNDISLRYSNRELCDVEMRRYERDMELPVRIMAAISKAEEPK